LFVGLAIVAVVVLFFVLPVVGTYNRLVGLDEGVDSQWAQVENVYQRRADLIPNLVATVQGSATFERETLTALTEARSRAQSARRGGESIPDDPAALRQFEQAQRDLGLAINVVVEAYPDIKSTENFRVRQDQLEGSENRIGQERRRYNTAARDFNTARSRFPANLAAGIFGFDRKAYFTAEEGASEVPDVGDLLKPTPTPGQ
jgi:LemA protein